MKLAVSASDKLPRQEGLGLQSSLGMETSKGPQTRSSKHQFPWVTLNLQAAVVQAHGDTLGCWRLPEGRAEARESVPSVGTKFTVVPGLHSSSS